MENSKRKLISQKAKLSLLVLSSFVIVGCGNGSTSSSSLETSSSSGEGSSSSQISSSSSSSSETVTYTITWKDDDGTILYTATMIEGEDEPQYLGKTPTKDDDNNAYTFLGWSKEADEATGNITYTATYSSSKKFSFSFDSGTSSYVLKSCHKPLLSAKIPETYDDGTNGEHAVTSIGANAVSQQAFLTSISIPDSIVSVDVTSFTGCTALTSFSVGKGLALIDNYEYSEGFLKDSGLLSSITVSKENKAFSSFSNCLIDLTYGALIRGCSSSSIPTASSVSMIAPRAFIGSATLESIDIPDNIIDIEYEAFSKCPSLKSVSIGSGCQYLYGNAFSYCPKLASLTVSASNDALLSSGNCVISKDSKSIVCACEPFTIPTDSSIAISISDMAFSSCTEMTLINIPSNFVHISNYGFDGCNSITSLTIDSGNPIYLASGNCIVEKSDKTITAMCGSSFVIPTSSDVATSIGRSALIDSSITSLVIPGNITALNSHSFYYCKSLESVTIGNGVVDIPSSCFSSCEELSSVSLGSLVASISMSSFYDSPKLSSISVDPANSVLVSIDNCIINKSTKTLLLGCKSSVIPTDSDTVTSIGEGAFFGVKDLGELVVPSNILTIGNDAFAECTGLTKITISDGVTSLGYATFESCSDLSELVLGKDVADIDGSVFYNCTSLSTITVSASSATYSSLDNCLVETSSKILALAGADSLIPTDADAVTLIGSFALCNIQSETVTIPSNINTVFYNAFEDNAAVKTVNVSDGVISLGESVFNRCKNLEKVTIGKDLNYIGAGVFSGCNSLKTIEIDANNETFTAYNTCIIDTAINAVVAGSANCTLPDDGSATMIGSYAFYAIERDYVFVPEGYTVIADSAFMRSGVERVSLPSTLTTIDRSAFMQAYGFSEIIIPKNVTTIGSSAFENDSDLTLYMEAAEAPVSGFDSSWNKDVKATYWYSETSNTDGSHWHYVDGKAVVWR